MQNTGSFQMIVAFMKAYPWRSAVLLVCLLFAGLSEGIGIASLLPLLNLAMGGKELEDTPLGRFFEDAFSKVGLTPSLGIMLCLMVISILFKSGFGLLAMKQVGYTVAYVVTDLRLALVRSLMKARWDYFVSQPVGIFTNAMSTEALRLSKGYRLACIIMAGVIQVLFYLTIALLISWKVTVVSLLVGIVLTVLLMPLVKVARRAGIRQTESFISLLTHLTDLLNGIKPIKAMSQENHLGTILEDESKKLKMRCSSRS